MQGSEGGLSTEQMSIVGESMKLLRRGSGPKVLVLHDEWGIGGDETLWQLLGEQFEVIAPIAPGFEDTAVSSRVNKVRDLALLYNALLAQLSDDPITVIGVSFGAWVAIEMAVMNPSRIAKLVLLGPVGLRFGAPDQRNIADLFALSEAQLVETLYVNPAVARVVTAESPRESVVTWARNREASAVYGWEPYFHTPGLQDWTEYVPIPVVVIYGSEDHFVMDGYFESYAGSFPNSSRIEIPNAGHFPHVDAPQQTFDVLKPLLP